MKTVEIRQIFDPALKSSICDTILRKLPVWFGIEESIVEYTGKVCGLPFYAAFDGGAIGFLAIQEHNPFTAEVCVMGVLSEYHRRGIGAALMGRAEDFCRAHGHQYLTVKTLDSSAVYEPYERTRNFYRSMGFIQLEVFPLLWDEANPCLFLAKHLG